jgi:hypothetical protein
MKYIKFPDVPANRPVCRLPDGKYEAWLEGEPKPAWYQSPVDSVSIPDVTSWQLTQALIETGMIAAVESLVATTADPLIKYGWSKATTYNRRDPVVLAAQAGMGLTDAQVDGLFALAASK